MGDPKLLKEMGERIYCRRKILNLTQEALAERLGVSTQMISNLELGKKAIRPENLIKLSNALGISSDYILKGGDTENDMHIINEKLIKLSCEEIDLINKMIDFLISKK